jgi:hypothetical protein
MTAIRYDNHFTTLAVAAVVFWFARDLRFPYWIANFNFFHYALMGALHATSIVVSLRDRRTRRHALGFITLATVLSAWTPFMALLGSIVLVPFADILREYDLGAVGILVVGSAIGATAYWLLVKWFWLMSLRRVDLLRTVAVCVTATLLLGLALHMFGGYDRGVEKINSEVISPVLTVGWWLAFSISLYWSEMSEQADDSAQSVETIT